MQCVEILQDNSLQWFYDIGVVAKHTHLEYGVFKKKLFYFYFYFYLYLMDYLTDFIWF